MPGLMLSNLSDEGFFFWSREFTNCPEKLDLFIAICSSERVLTAIRKLDGVYKTIELGAGKNTTPQEYVELMLKCIEESNELVSYRTEYDRILKMLQDMESSVVKVPFIPSTEMTEESDSDEVKMDV